MAEGKARWNEESFFKEGKHQFGLAQFAARTEVGLDRWVLLVFLAWTLAILHRQAGMTLEACAALALLTVMPLVYLNRLLRTYKKNADFLAQHGYSLHYARCKYCVEDEVSSGLQGPLIGRVEGLSSLQDGKTDPQEFACERDQRHLLRFALLD